MKKIFTLLFASFLAVSTFAQFTVSVSERDMKVDKISRTGLALHLDLDKKLVKDLWKKHLKEYGKVNGDLSMETASIPAISSKNVRCLSMVESDGKGCIVWWAIDLGDKWVTKSGGTGYASAEKILKDFGKSCYREDINEQIQDAEKALEKVVKDEEKVVKEGESLAHDLEKNGEEKIRLQNELKENADEKVKLEADIAQNKKDQEAAKKEVAKYQKAVEVVKAKLDQIR